MDLEGRLLNRAGRRAARGKSRPPAKLAACSGAVILLTLGIGTAAGACSAGAYQYAGKQSANQYKGVEGNISVTTESNPNGASSHISNYLNMWSRYANCVGQGICWIQAGNSLGGTGLGGTNCTASIVEAYMEEGDGNGYDCNDIPPGVISLTQEDYYTEFYAQSCNAFGFGLVDAEVFNGSSWYLIGQAWEPNCALSTIQAVTEFADGSATCPGVTSWEMYGYGTTKTLHKSSNGSAWTVWSTGAVKIGPTAPLTMTTPKTSAKFKTYT